MKGLFFLFLSGFSCAWGVFCDIESGLDLQKKMLTKKDYIIAIGIEPCIPCERIKLKLIHDQKKCPDIFWIDLKKHPMMRQVFNFKAVPYLAVYKHGEPFMHMTGELECKEYLRGLHR